MNKSLVSRFVLSAILSFALAAIGCSSDGDGDGGSGGTAGTGGGGMGGDGGMGGGGMGGGGMGGMGGTGGSEVGTVTATPAGTTFNPAIQVELSTDGGDPIYYTTDLSSVLDETAPCRAPSTPGRSDLDATRFEVPHWNGRRLLRRAIGRLHASTNTPIRAEWAKSGHGDIAAEAWRHWDEDGEVSEPLREVSRAARQR